MTHGAWKPRAKDRRRQDEQLVREIARLRDFAELSSDWSWEQDAELRFTAISRVSVDHLPLKEVDFLGRRRWDLPIRAIPEEHLRAHIVACERHLPFRDFEYEVGDESGVLLRFSVSGRPVFDVNGKFCGYRGIGRNVTELHRARMATQASERKLTQIVDGSPVPAFVIDTAHRVTHWNRACENLTGVSASDVLGCTDVGHAFHQVEQPSLVDLIVDGVCAGEIATRYADEAHPSSLIDGAYQVEEYFPNLRGQGRWLYYTAAPLRDQQGKLIGAIETLQDVTDRHLAETSARARWEELKMAHAELQHAMQQLVHAEKLAAMGRLVAGMAHELNTPIGNALVVATTLDELMISFAADCANGTLRRSALNQFISQGAEAMHILTSSVDRAAKLVHRFKEVVPGDSSAARRKFDLCLLVEEITKSLDARLRDAAVRICNDIPAGIAMDSYAGAISQVIHNLIENSLVHGFDGSQGGQIDFTAQADGQWINLFYHDNGRGIPEEVRKNAFDPFFTTRFGQGQSGLGLFLVHNLVTGVLGGQVTIPQSRDPGMSVHLSLPRSAPPTPPTTLKETGQLPT